MNISLHERTTCTCTSMIRRLNFLIIDAFKINFKFYRALFNFVIQNKMLLNLNVNKVILNVYLFVIVSDLVIQDHSLNVNMSWETQNLLSEGPSGSTLIVIFEQRISSKLSYRYEFDTLVKA